MRIKFILILVTLLGLGFVCASATYASHNFIKDYGAGSTLSGYVEMSFNDESGASLFTDNFGNFISLRELLIKNSQTSACDSDECNLIYESSNPAFSKSLDFSEGEYAFVGVKLTGNVEAISTFEFNISSDAVASCTNQLGIDVYSDNKIDLVNDKVTSEVCSSKSYGCFDYTNSATNYVIDNIPYCQKINLKKASGYQIGAYIVPDGTPRTIQMYIHNGSQVVGKICDLPTISSAGEYSCNINFSNPQDKDFYVCMKSISGQGYTTRGYIGDDVCGFHGNPPQNSVASYQIFAQPLKFDAVGNLFANNLAKSSEEYLKKNYGVEMNCGSEGCLIPIKIYAETSQTIGLNNLNLVYSTLGGGLIEKNFYDVIEASPLVNLEKKKLNFDGANFTLPSKLGSYDYTLNFNDKKLFSETLNIKKTASIKSISPNKVVAGYPTEFSIYVDSAGTNITLYEWNFDGVIKTTQKPEIVYTFDKINLSEIKITITDGSLAKSSKTFLVNVTSPKNDLPEIIEERLNQLDTLKKQVATYPEFYQTALNEILDLENAETKLELVQISYSENLTDEDYISLVKNLCEVYLPEEIFVSKSAKNVDFFYNKKNMDLSFLAEIGRIHDVVDYSSNQDLFHDAILLWDEENLNTKLNYEQISSRDGGEVSILLNTFDFSITESNNLDVPYFVVVGILEGMKFDASDFESKGNYFYREVTGSGSFKVVTSEDLDFFDFPLFISPELKRLSVSPGQVVDTKEISAWLYFILIILVLILIGFGVYVYLQIWYKKKYESYLFKNQNDLYNLISFVQREKEKGLVEKDVRIKLQKAGWTLEQINYVLRKYSGKRTGMLEIPIFNLFKKDRGNLPQKNSDKARFRK